MPGRAFCWERDEGNWSTTCDVASSRNRAHSSSVSTASGSVRIWVGGLSTAVLVLALTACGSDQTNVARPTSTSATSRLLETTTPSSLPSQPSRRNRIVATVRNYWATYLYLGSQTGPFDAESTREALARVATGRALDRLLSVLQANAAVGYVVRGSIASNPRVVSRVGNSAKVLDCYDDRTGLFQVVDDVRIDQDDPLPHLATFGLVLKSDGWKVTTNEPSEAPCAGS